MRDAVHMHTLHVQINAEEIDLTDAIFQGVKSEIDKRKGRITPRDNSNIPHPNNLSTRGSRGSQHIVGNGHPSRGRRQGRRGGNI